VAVGNTGGWQNWQTVKEEVNLSAGEQTLRMQFSGGSGYLLNVNYLVFNEKTSENVQQQFALNPIQDAYLEDGNRFNTQELRTESEKRISYLMFDLGNISAPVDKAILKLTVGDDPGYGSLEVWKGSHINWTEDNLSNSNKPSKLQMISSVDKEFHEGQTYSFVLSNVEPGKKVSLMILHGTNNSVADVAFASSESGDTSSRPELIVTTSSNARLADVKAKNTSTGVEEALTYPTQLESVKVFPNPASTYVEVRAVNERTPYILLNTNGQEILRGTLDADSRIDVSSLSKGLYILRLLGSPEAVYQKVLIE
jgi:hypothetical protein